MARQFEMAPENMHLCKMNFDCIEALFTNLIHLNTSDFAAKCHNVN